MNKLLFVMVMVLCLVSVLNADETQIFTAQTKPNILLIIDNSLSMDESFYGDAVGSYLAGSKMYSEKQALTNIVNTYNSSTYNTIRFGLMTFKDSGNTGNWYLHDSPYFASYRPATYCPDPPPEPACVAYCQNPSNSAAKSVCQSSCVAQNPSFDDTYLPDLTMTTADPSFCNLTYPKTNEVVNPTDASHYIYAKGFGCYYDTSNDGTSFCYSSNYTAGEVGANQATPYSFKCWTSKTGTSDAYSVYGGTNNYNGAFALDDTDIGGGYSNIGQRNGWWYVARSYDGTATVTAPQGYLHVAVNDNNTSNNTQLNALTTLLNYNQTPVQYMSCVGLSPLDTCPFIFSNGWTPTAGTLLDAYKYFTGTFSQGATNYNSPIQYSCQRNFVLFATDGSPDTDVTGNVLPVSQLMPDVLTKITNLRNVSYNGHSYDIQTYVLGLGMTDLEQPYLDAMAQAGGTADPSGNAYFANNVSELTSAFGSILTDIISKSYGFASSSVASARVNDENYIYEASFVPVNINSLWPGHLDKYNINSDGSIGSLVWDAGEVLQGNSSRNVQTYMSNALTPFTTSIGKDHFGVSDAATKNMIVNYILGSGNPDNWNLGDIFHSNPITIGTPNPYYIDPRDSNGAYAQYSSNNVRTSANGNRIIMAGANDGQFHVFRTLDGLEEFSFIPSNLMLKLQYLAHSSNPTTLTHQYFIDGPTSAADVWLGTGSGTAKSASDWHTLVVFAEGRPDGNYSTTPGAGSTLYWSSNTSCSSTTLNNVYGAPYNYFCGYWAFDFTNTLNPSFEWLLSPTAAQAQYVGDPWSQMAMGKVLINNNETWVGFIGGGYNPVSCSSGSCSDARGKAFNVVSLTNGNILWGYNCGLSGGACTTNMLYSLPAGLATVDTDNDGFIDKAYIGDLNGNIWRIRLCTAAAGPTCNTTNWNVSLFYNAGTAGTPVYTTPTVARDAAGNTWVYWGTGDIVNPLNTSSQDYFYAIKDTDFQSTWTSANVEILSPGATATGEVNAVAAQGWGVQLATGEKVLANPVVFGGAAYFTTYVPSTSSDPCTQAGSGNLYALNMTKASSVLPSNAVNMSLGTGIPTAPLLSVAPSSPGTAPTANLYVTVSGGSGTSASTFKVSVTPTMPTTSNLLYWKDMRVQ